MSLEIKIGTPVFDYEADSWLQDEMVGVTQNTREFLLLSLSSGALQEVPNYFNEERWLQNLDITYRYFIGGESLQEIGGKYKKNNGKIGTSRQHIQQKIAQTVSYIWHSSSTEVQEEFPILELNLEKDWGEYNAVHFQRKFEELISAGFTEQETLDELGLTRQELMQRRTVLHNKYGIALPKADGTTGGKIGHEYLADRLATAESDKEIAELLSKVSSNFYYRHSQGENPLLLPLSKVFRTEGPHGFGALFKHLDNVKEELGLELPIGILRSELQNAANGKEVNNYYFIASRQMENALRIKKRLVELGIIKDQIVFQVAGPQVERLPNTTELASGENLMAIRSLFLETGINPGKPGSSLSDYLDGCPVPIFFYNGIYRCYKEDQEALAEFLRSKKI